MLFSNDCSRTKVEFAAGGELFHCVGQHVTAKGFTSIMPWMAVGEKNLPQFTKAEKINILNVDLYEVEFCTPCICGFYFVNNLVSMYFNWSFHFKVLQSAFCNI